MLIDHGTPQGSRPSNRAETVVGHPLRVRRHRLQNLDQQPVRSGDLEPALSPRLGDHRQDHLQARHAARPWSAREPDLTEGPVLLTEGRLMGVWTGHELAGRTSVSMEDFAGRTGGLSQRARAFVDVASALGPRAYTAPLG